MPVFQGFARRNFPKSAVSSDLSGLRCEFYTTNAKVNIYRDGRKLTVKAGSAQFAVFPMTESFSKTALIKADIVIKIS